MVNFAKEVEECLQGELEPEQAAFDGLYILRDREGHRTTCLEKLVWQVVTMIYPLVVFDVLRKRNVLLDRHVVRS